MKKGKINKNGDRQLKLLFFFSSCFLSDYPQCQRTLDNCGQDGSVPFVPDGREDHLLSLIVNCNVQEGGLLLVQDHIGIVAQEQGDGFGMALPPGDLPLPGIEPESLMSPAGGFFSTSTTWKAPEAHRSGDNYH